MVLPIRCETVIFSKSGSACADGYGNYAYFAALPAVRKLVRTSVYIARFVAAVLHKEQAEIDQMVTSFFNWISFEKEMRISCIA